MQLTEQNLHTILDDTGLWSVESVESFLKLNGNENVQGG